jgi:pimeloyl-ACP methyl ester carboxylesterase
MIAVPYAAAGDTEVHYEERGKGPPLLLLMGFGAAGDLWGSEFLDALAKRFRLLLVDNRGTGLTHRGTAPYTIVQLAEDALAVLDKEGLLSAHVFGVSMGGMIAQEIAIRHPARVRGLVLGCTTPGGAEETQPRRTIIDDLERNGLFGGRMNGLLVTPEYLARRTGLLTRLAIRALARPTSLTVLGEQLAAVESFDTSTRLHEIIAPTLVITGDKDAIIPHQNSRLLVRGIKGAQGVIVKDTAHCFFWEAPDRAAAAIVQFLENLTP